MPFLTAIVMLILGAGCQPDEHGSVTTVGSSEGPVFEMRLVEASHSPNSEPMTLHSKDKDGNPIHEVLFVQKTASMDAASVRRTWIWKRGDVVGIDIYLTDAASKQFAALTRQNVGRRVAIVLDGRLRLAPTIRGEIPSGKFDMISDWTLDEAKSLARKIEQASKSPQNKRIP